MTCAVAAAYMILQLIASNEQRSAQLQAIDHPTRWNTNVIFYRSFVTECSVVKTLCCLSVYVLFRYPCAKNEVKLRKKEEKTVLNFCCNAKKKVNRLFFTYKTPMNAIVARNPRSMNTKELVIACESILPSDSLFSFFKCVSLLLFAFYSWFVLLCVRLFCMLFPMQQHTAKMKSNFKSKSLRFRWFLNIFQLMLCLGYSTTKHRFMTICLTIC